MSSPSASELFARWASQLKPADLPDQVVQKVRLHLLDSLGCIAAAIRSGTGGPALEAAASWDGPPQATLVGSARKGPLEAALLAAGCLLHCLDFDDTHAASLVHASAVVVPMALAGAEAGRQAIGLPAGGALSNEEVLCALAAGYELACRIGVAVPHGFHERGLHATSVCGVFSSAAVAGKLFGLPAEAIRDALGICGSLAGGILEFLNSGSDTKTLHPGLAACSAALATRLASRRAAGPPGVFEGDKGLFAALLGKRVDPGTLTSGLGERWELEQMGVKLYPACQLSHASLDALSRALSSLGPVSAEDLEEITLEVPRDAMPIVCEPQDAKVAPRSPYEAKFSLQWSAAALVISGGIGLDTYQPSALGDARVASLASRVRCEPQAGAGPPGMASSRASVRLGDGRRAEAVALARGTPQCPATRQDVIEKLERNCADPGLARRLELAVFEDAEPWSALLDALAGPATSAAQQSSPTKEARH